MNNQQPSSCKMEKVQRLSRKGVLDNNIVWETPQTNNYYIYYLCLKESNIPVYYGITNNPEKRFYDHTHIKKHQNHELKEWILDYGRLNINMVIFNSFNNFKEAKLSESAYIKNTKYKLFNISEYKIRKGKSCLVYDILTQETINFDSIKKAKEYLGVDFSFSQRLVKYRFLIALNRHHLDYRIKNEYSYKAKCLKTNKVTYFFTTQQGERYFNVRRDYISLTLKSKRKSIRNHVFAYKGEDFPKYDNLHWKKIKCLNDGKIFNKILDAANYYNVDRSGITKVCKGMRKHVGGYQFSYIC